MLGKLYGIGRQAGLTDAADERLHAGPRPWPRRWWRSTRRTPTADGIDATPTFLINGEKVSNMPWEEFAAKLDAALGA